MYFCLELQFNPSPLLINPLCILTCNYTNLEDMKLLKITLLLAALLSSIIACSSPETTTATDETTTPEITEPATPEPAPVVEAQENRTTLEGFWAIVQIAVANKDKEILKQLSKSGAGASLMVEDDYAPLIAEIKATDFKESSRQENGKKMYEYMMSMNYEDTAEENQPTITIFLWKDEAGDFEIFDLFEAG